MKKIKLIIDIKSLKEMVREFEEMQEDQIQGNPKLKVGFEKNLELAIIE